MDDYPIELGRWSGSGALLLAAACVLALLGSAIVVLQRRFRSEAALFVLSHAASLTAAALLFFALQIVEPPAGDEPYMSVRRVVVELVVGYWPTFTVFWGLFLFIRLNGEHQQLVGSLAPIPVFLWGLDTTNGLWKLFNSHFSLASVYLVFGRYWLLVSVVSLAMLLLATYLWWRSVGRPRVHRMAMSAAAVTIVAVFADWTFFYVALRSFAGE